MQVKNKESFERRLQKLEKDIQALRVRLARSRDENIQCERSLKKMDDIFHSLPSGVILLQQGRVLEINNTILQQLGYRAEDVTGRDFLDLIHPEQKESIAEVHSLWETGKMAPDQYEATLLKQNNKNLPYDIKIRPIRVNNRKTFLLNLADLERRKEKERETLRSKKTEALVTMASALKKELFSHSHSLMTGIKILRSKFSGKDRTLSRTLEEIEKSSHNIQSLIGVLEMISGTESEGQGITPFHLNETVKKAISSTVEKWKMHPESQGVKINLRTYLRSSSLLEGNPDAISSVIIYMLNNAVEAMPSGGDLYITTEDNAGLSHVYIQDSGTGIPKESMDRVFDPFFTTKGDDFMGLGLSLSYAMIRRHQGSIEISSQEGQGTVLHILLPFIHKEAAPETKSDRMRMKETHILIIQEDDIARGLLFHLFTNRGCKVDAAGDGIEGLGKLKRKKYDLMIADIETLQMDQELFIKKIKESNPEMFIVMILVGDMTKDIHLSDQSMVDLTMIKPLDMNRAVKQIQDLLTSR